MVRVYRLGKLAAIERNVNANRRLRKIAVVWAFALFCIGLFWFTWARMFFVGVTVGMLPLLYGAIDCALDVTLENERRRAYGRHSGAHPRPDARNPG